MRSALVNNTTNIVENVIVADPVTPSPYEGCFMVGLQDPIYEEQSIQVSENLPAGTTYSINLDNTVTFTLTDGSTQDFPAGTVIVVNQDDTITVTYMQNQYVEISAGTACGIGWIYNPVTGTFSE